MSFLLSQCQASFAQYGSVLATLFLAGLVGGFTHCAGMCGPFVLAQCGKSDVTIKRESGLLLPYHLGRMTTYVILGMVAATLSRQIMGTPLQQSVSVAFLALAGLVFIGSALPAFKLHLGNWHLGGLSNTISRLARPLLNSSAFWHRYGLGVLLGFLPCGLIFAALMVVATTDNIFTAALAMALFTLSTVPSLLMVGIGGNYALKKWPETTQGIARIVMLGNGISLFALAGKMVW